MTGLQALRYARSRHTSSDFDRGARQQRLLLSLREQADPQVLIPHLTDLVDGAEVAVRTDIPRQPARRAARARLIRSTRRTSARTSSRRRSTRPSSPTARRGYIIVPEGLADPRRGHERVQDQPRATRPSARRSPRRAPRLGPQRAQRPHARRRTSRATSSTRASPRRRRARARRAASPPRRRSWSTTAPRTSYADTIAYLETTLRRQGDRGDRPGDPDGHHRDDRPLDAAPQRPGRP